MSRITLDVAATVATLTVDAPAGGFDRPLVEALTATAAELTARHPELRAVVVTTAGPDFGSGWSAGALAEAAALPSLSGVLAPLGAGFAAIADVPQPTVATIRGVAHSAGLELALACDMRVAAAGATFAMPETARGLVPRGGGTQRLPRIVGRAQALRLLLTGECIDAAEALRIGLVSAVVPDGEEVAAATAIARTIASRGPLATRFVKEAITRGIELPLEEALRLELELTVLLQTTADRAEGVAAFVEGREPGFVGR